MKSKQNKYLIVKQNVILNEKLDDAIYKLEPYFRAVNLIAYVTSGIRTANDQLRIIKDYLTRKNIKDEFINDDVNSKVVYNGEQIYSWQLAWSKLLNANVIINPPLQAKLLLSYIGRTGKDRKGDLFNPSPHFAGKSFDIGGGANSITDEKQALISAIKAGAVPMIKGFVEERQNNCLHVDVI
jgi:hypothetical protein